MSNQNVAKEQEIQFIEVSEIELKHTIEQIQSLILLLEAVGSQHPQYFQLASLNEKLQKSTNELNNLNAIKNKIQNENI